MRPILMMTAALALAACNNDVLSTKPETDAELPPPVEAPASETPVAPSTPAAPVTEPATPAPTPAPAPMIEGPIPTDRGTDPVPFTDKKVRSLRNDATMTLNPGQTLTVVLNVNTSDGFDWRMAPVPTGVTLYGDYYRAEAPAPGVPNIGGARSFLFRGDAPGRYPITIQHTNGTDIRAAKSFWIEVAAPPAPAPAPVTPATPPETQPVPATPPT